MVLRGPGEQISFRVKLPVAKQIKRSAEAEDLAVADFVRKVFMVGMREYQRNGSLHAIRILEEAQERARASVAIDRHAQRAADLLVEDEKAELTDKARGKNSGRKKAGS